jgi:hypothetical protein
MQIVWNKFLAVEVVRRNFNRSNEKKFLAVEVVRSQDLF